MLLLLNDLLEGEDTPYLVAILLWGGDFATIAVKIVMLESPYKTMTEKPLAYDEMKEKKGLSILYVPSTDGSVTLQAVADTAAAIEAKFSPERIDEAHILYMEATELLRSRAGMNEDRAAIRDTVEKLFALFRGEKVSFPPPPVAVRQPSAEFVANPGKVIDIDVDGVTYQRLPVRTRLISMADTDIQPLLDDYVKPYLKEDDVIYISEKALTITQGRVVDMSSIKPTALAHFLAKNVGNNYGSSDFHGFGHGTSIAMQLFIEEAGYARILLAAAVSAITRPFGIRGLFYRICGLRAKSIDCPMSFLILEYAHSAKLAPNDPSGAARKIKAALNGHEVVILDANYRGAFSLGKSTRSISESFIGKLFRDNPLGQSDEMTPFCIVRKA
jgi:hypothetical protein